MERFRSVEDVAAGIDAAYVGAVQPEYRRDPAPWRAEALTSVAAALADDPLGRLMRLARRTKSPIEERLLYGLVRAALDHGVSVDGVFTRERSAGLLVVEPQPEISGLHPDFRVALAWLAAEEPVAVLVECDGHDYHERTKEQARRDKQRDRRLAGDGWTVLRFAGSEIHADMYACGDAVLQHLIKQAGSRG